MFHQQKLTTNSAINRAGISQAGFHNGSGLHSSSYRSPTLVPSTNRVVWGVDYTMAQTQAVESDKLIIIFFTGKWCSPCRIMKREVWADEQVMATVNEAFIPMMINVDDSNALATLNRYSVSVTPTTIITDSKGNVLQYKQGRISKADFFELLGKMDPFVFSIIHHYYYHK